MQLTHSLIERAPLLLMYKFLQSYDQNGICDEIKTGHSPLLVRHAHIQKWILFHHYEFIEMSSFCNL